MAEVIDFKNLFQPISIGPMQLRNRIVMLPMHLRLDPTTEQGKAFYVARAKGGVAAIVSWATAVDLLVSDSAWGEPGGVAAFVKSLRPLIQGVHEAGAKIGMQLGHYNFYPAVLPYSTNWLRPITGKEVVEFVAPSARVEPTGDIHGGAPPGLGLRQLTVPEIEDIIDKFSKAAAKAKEIGFDFVEIHAAHGTLPCQFFSPLDNRRSDRYGGDLARRMTFGLECVKGMKSSAGKDYPVFFRIAAQDFDCPGGITLADSTAYAAELERAGADCFDVSVGIKGGTPYWQHVAPGPKMPTGTFAPLAEAIKRKVRVPVIAVGKINTPDVAESILAQGRADLIGIARQLITDPLWPRKAMEKRTAEIVACTSCNRNCWAGPGVDLPLDEPLCNENPEAGRER